MTQKDQIRQALENGDVLSPLDALDRFKCFRLAARVAELKREGLPIVSGSAYTPSGKRIASYYLPDVQGVLL